MVLLRWYFLGVGTLIDPMVCRADHLVGSIVGHNGKLPGVYIEIDVNYFLLRRLLGVKTEDKKQAKVSKLGKSEILMVNIGSTAAGARVMRVKDDFANLILFQPCCTIKSTKRLPSAGVSTTIGGKFSP